MADRDTRTHAQRRKAENVEAIRDRLAQYGHHDQAIKIIEKIQDVDGKLAPTNIGIEQLEVKRLEVALKGHLSMMNHYMPKVTEILTPPESGGIKITYVVPDGNDKPDNTPT